jgi:hypothetical protein
MLCTTDKSMVSAAIEVEEERKSGPPRCHLCDTRMIQIYTRTRNSDTGKVEVDAVAHVCLAHQIAIFHDKPGVVYLFMPEKEAKLLKSLKGIVSKGVGKQISKNEAAALFKDVARLLQLSVIVQEPDLLETPVTSDGRPTIPELPVNLRTSEQFEHDKRTQSMLDAETHATNAALPGVKVSVSYREDADNVARDAAKAVDEIASDLSKEIVAAKINDDINKKVGNDASASFKFTSAASENAPQIEEGADSSGLITNVLDEGQIFPGFYYSVDRHMFSVSDGDDMRVAQILEKKSWKVLARAKLYRVAKDPDKWMAKREELSLATAQ